MKETGYVSSSGITPDKEEPLQYHWELGLPAGIGPSWKYRRGLILKDAVGIYEKTAEPFDVFRAEDFPQDEMALGEVYITSGIPGNLIYVSEVIGDEVISQAEDYNPPDGLGFGTWDNRYAKIGTIANDYWTGTAGSITHTLYRDGEQWKYKLHKNVTLIDGVTTDSVDTIVNVDVLYESRFDVQEGRAYCVNSGNCLNEWVPMTCIIRGSDLYVRSDTLDPFEVKIRTTPAFRQLDRLGEKIPWGWTYLRPLRHLAPLDKKKYTYLEETGGQDVEYLVTGYSDKFNTVALNGVLADSIDIEFLPSDGSEAIPVITIDPDNSIDVDDRLPGVPTTVIIYAPRDITGDVKLTFKTVKRFQLGGIRLGQSVNAGFTNLVFTNKFKDYSPFEKDQFGNILYVPGVKTNIYKGTVDVMLTSYDMNNRLMASIGGKTVIVNGSDSLDNLATDSENFFSSTMIVGRIRNFELKTKLDKNKLSQKATYSFEIEEDV